MSSYWLGGGGGKWRGGRPCQGMKAKPPGPGRGGGFQKSQEAILELLRGLSPSGASNQGGQDTGSSPCREPVPEFLSQEVLNKEGLGTEKQEASFAWCRSKMGHPQGLHREPWLTSSKAVLQSHLHSESFPDHIINSATNSPSCPFPIILFLLLSALLFFFNITVDF